MNEPNMSACPPLSKASGYVRPLGGPIEAPKRTSGTDGHGQRTHLVVIGEFSTTVTMCRRETCISAAGLSGWCWSHRPDEVAT